MSKPRELTSWRGQRLGCVRTWKEGKIVRGTYFLEMVGVGTGQDLERKEASKGHKLPEEGRHQLFRTPKETQ